jgi:hypothetical protein
VRGRWCECGKEVCRQEKEFKKEGETEEKKDQ